MRFSTLSIYLNCLKLAVTFLLTVILIIIIHAASAITRYFLVLNCPMGSVVSEFLLSFIKRTILSKPSVCHFRILCLSSVAYICNWIVAVFPRISFYLWFVFLLSADSRLVRSEKGGPLRTVTVFRCAEAYCGRTERISGRAWSVPIGFIDIASIFILCLYCTFKEFTVLLKIQYCS